MNGPQHYRQAERLLRSSESANSLNADLIVKQAQVHADLAKAAAIVDVYRGGTQINGWREVLS